MKKITFFYGIIFTAIMILSSCTQQSKDVSKDIKEANKVFMEAFNNANSDAVTQCYTTDAKLFPSNSEIIEGHEAINKFWKGAMSMGVKKALLETVSAIGYGNIAIEEGKYSLYADNDQIIDHGKYIVTWQKVGEEWKMKRDIWNTNHPSVEPKYQSSEENFIAHLAASISFAKLNKVTPGDYGKYVGGLHADGWQPKGEDNLKYFLGGYKWNMNLFKNFHIEIIEQSDTFVKAKLENNWNNLSEGEKSYGVNSAEMNEWLKELWIVIADHCDLEYKQELDGNWIVFTVRKK